MNRQALNKDGGEIKERLRCWEFYDCDKIECPAYQNKDLPCWLVSGTHCRNEIQGKFYDKLEECVKCRVFLSEMDGEEGRQVVEKVVSSLHSMVAKLEEEEEHLKLENIYLKKRLSKEYAPDLVVGANKQMEQIYSLITKVAVTDSTVLLTGETGTGKGLFARAVHYHSPRSSQPFVPVNCSTLSESLLESELFGHVKGAFTSATSDKHGLFELANKGTFFFDEIGDISLAIQGKLLEVLQDKTTKRVGGTKPVKVDVRIIAATNKDIEAHVKEGRFREDLFYRLNVFPIHLPALRERKEDIPALAEYFLEKFNRERKKGAKGIHKKALKKLIEYEWPGNIREFENVIERAVILAEEDLIRLEHLPIYIKGKREGTAAVEEKEVIKTLDELEREHILRVLKLTSNKRSEVAKLLGIDRKTLYRKIKVYKLETAGHNVLPVA
ncbi:MAG: sigma-54 dependent transcriptional regulator [bacterium]